MAAINVAAACVWIGSIYVPIPQRFAMLWVAIGIGAFPSCDFPESRLVWILGDHYYRSYVKIYVETILKLAGQHLRLLSR